MLGGPLPGNCAMDWETHQIWGAAPAVHLLAETESSSPWGAESAVKSYCLQHAQCLEMLSFALVSLLAPALVVLALC